MLSSSMARADGTGACQKRMLGSVLQDEYRPFAPMWVIQATQAQLATGLSRTREKPTFLPTAPKNTALVPNCTVSFKAGRPLKAGPNSQ